MGRNFDDYPGFLPFRSWANTYAQDCRFMSFMIFWLCNFEMSFWCHRLDQISNKNIFALKVFIASLGLPGSFFWVPVGFLIDDITY